MIPSKDKVPTPQNQMKNNDFKLSIHSKEFIEDDYEVAKDQLKTWITMESPQGGEHYAWFVLKTPAKN